VTCRDALLVVSLYVRASGQLFVNICGKPYYHHLAAPNLGKEGGVNRGWLTRLILVN
jgi:hypothetical protein